MPHTFNLVDQPWIPCATHPGEPPHLLSLRAIFAEAPHLASISDPSPAVTISLHRFLLAILHRSLDGPRSVADWKTIWDRGTWDLSSLNAYLDRWHHRCDLFDPQHPFYQSPGLATRTESTPPTRGAHRMTPNTATQLSPERASDRNRALLFDHSADDATLTPAEAARYLIAMHNFAVGGLISLPQGEPIANKYTSAAPLLGGAVVLVRDQTLFQTLMLNWVRYNRDDEVPFPFGGDDQPAWERGDGGAQPVSRLPDGLVDLLTWQSRRILLVPDVLPDGTLCVRDTLLMKGYQFADGFEQWTAETMLAFRKNMNRNARNGSAVFALRLDADRAVWRDSHALFQSVADEQHRPKVMSWLNSLLERRSLDEQPPLTLDIYGLIPRQATIEDWRSESLPLPLRLVAEGHPATRQLLERLRQAVALAEDVGRLFDVGWVPLAAREKPLPSPMWTLCDALLAGMSEREPRRDDCASLARSFGVGPRYWSQLETPFRDFIRQLVAPSDVIEEGGTTRYGVLALRAWASTVERIAHAVFDGMLNDLSGSSRELHASAIAEQRFYYLLTLLLTPHRPELAAISPTPTPTPTPLSHKE